MRCARESRETRKRYDGDGDNHQFNLPSFTGAGILFKRSGVHAPDSKFDAAIEMCLVDFNDSAVNWRANAMQLLQSWFHLRSIFSSVRRPRHS